MKKKSNCQLFIILFAIASVFSQSALGQIRIKWEESSSLAKTIVFDVPEGKALLVFEGKDNFRFDSDNENINQPKKDGLLYKLLVDIEPSSGAITIQHEGAENAFINYGKLNDIGSLPALKSKEIKYFKLILIKPLDYFDITNQKKKEGATDFQGLTEKDALIILYTQPQNLELQIEGPTTKVVQEEGRYKIYVMPEVRKLNLKSKNYDETPIDLEGLTSKEVRYFRVQMPPSNVDVESFDPNIKVGNYSIETNPAGALIQMKGNPFFDDKRFKTPYTIEGLTADTYIITLDLDRYESICDTILISSTRGKKSKYNLIPKFAFLNCNIEPAIPTAKIFLDGKELIGIADGKDYECLKGTHNVEIRAPHFYSQTKQISLAAGQSVELNVKLRAKMGTITIEPGENADGAEVFINEKSIGRLPIQNYSLQEGDYTISYKKSGLVTEQDNYSLNVNVNANKPFISPPMINLRKIKFSTDPQSGATVYIDGLERGATPLTLKLPVGTYKVLIRKDKYKDFSETINLFKEQTEFNYSLTPDYNLRLNSTPSGAMVRIDGQIVGSTPIDVLTAQGPHKVIFSEENSVRRVKYYTTDDIPRSKSTILRKDEFWGLGYISANEGTEFGIEIFKVGGRFLLSGSAHVPKPLVEMPSIAGTPSGIALGGQIGYRVPYPIDFIIHGGAGVRSFSEEGASTNSDAIDYWTGIAGFTLPIRITRGFGFYVNTDYWFKTENGKGLLMFSGGIIF